MSPLKNDRFLRALLRQPVDVHASKQATSWPCAKIMT